MNPARLLLPAIRWDAERGFDGAWARAERALQRGVGGFIVFGGEAAAVRELTTELQRRAPHPLLFGSDLERGAGQQFRGATPLPPAAALASLDEPATTRRAAQITAREARALGVGWIYAPVADVDLEPANPIVGTRAWGTEPERVAAHVAAWVEGCHAGGALCCVKHFPGHGRSRGDSHLERPRVDATRERLEQDLAPFRAAIAAGADSVMTAHVAYAALDPSERPATLSAPMLRELLRGELGFTGLVVTDALNMRGVTGRAGQAVAAVRALQAGCDMLLHPDDVEAVATALAKALDDGRLERDETAAALDRVARAAERAARRGTGAETAPARAPAGYGLETDRQWALETAVRTLRVVRGAPALPEGPVRLFTVDDDLGGPHPPPPRDALAAALAAAGVVLSDAADAAPLLAVYSDIRAWKARPGISAGARGRVRALTEAEPDATVLLFGHPRLAAELPSARHLLGCWGGEPLMQQAAARALTGA